MKNLNADTATIEELKAGVYDNLRQIDFLRNQNEALNQVIARKEQEPAVKEEAPKA
jgi:hypothetical protein